VYRVEWKYADLGEDGTIAYVRDDLWVYFTGLIRFLGVPPGKGHCRFFGFNVLLPDATRERYDYRPKRGFLAIEPVTYAAITQRVERAFDDAFARASTKEDALEELDKTLIFTDKDFSSEFADDLLDADVVAAGVERAFDGVSRGDGLTLHQALALDDYASEDEVLAAKGRDTEPRWQDVPGDVIAQSPSALTFLDEAGRRYYLPAYMQWALRNEDDPNDICFFTRGAVLPVVPAYDYGKGYGERHDVEAWVRAHGFSSDQVRAIYHFLCFSAISGGLGVNEEELPMMRAWRRLASTS